MRGLLKLWRRGHSYSSVLAGEPSVVSGNHAAVLLGANDLQFCEWPIPATPPHGHVRLGMEAVGICGSDLHYLRHAACGPFRVTAPLVLGHEGAGRVLQLGGGVTALAVGTRVAVEAGIPHWKWGANAAERYNLSPEMEFSATPPHHGQLATFFDHPAEWCYRIPDSLSFEQGALCEPLSVGIHALRRGRTLPGTRLAILGAGPIGLVTLAAARAFGALSIAITDLKDFNLRMAQSMGADKVIRVSRGDTPADTAAQICEALSGAPEVIIDACGFESSMATALAACASGGRVVLVGMGQSGPLSLDLAAASVREVDVCGSFRYAGTYPLALELQAHGRVALEPLITHRFGWSAAELAAGFEHATAPDAIKVMFRSLAGSSDAV